MEVFLGSMSKKVVVSEQVVNCLLFSCFLLYVRCFSIRLLLCDREKGVRTQALRALRYMIRTPEAIADILRLNIPVFLSR